MPIPVTLRAYLTAGTAAVVGAGALSVAPVTHTIASADLALPMISAPVTLSALDLPFLAELSQSALPGNAPDAAVSPQLVSAPSAYSVTTPIEVAIKDTYNAIEPWAAYAAELTQYVLGFIPAVWWVAPAIDLAYYTIEPLVQAGVYVTADVIGLNFTQIVPDINAGIANSINNAAYFGLAWLESLVPLPPLPPLPPFPGAAVTRATNIRATPVNPDVIVDEVAPPTGSIDPVVDPVVDPAVIVDPTGPVPPPTGGIDPIVEPTVEPPTEGQIVCNMPAVRNPETTTPVVEPVTLPGAVPVAIVEHAETDTAVIESEVESDAESESEVDVDTEDSEVHLTGPGEVLHPTDPLPPVTTPVVKPIQVSLPPVVAEAKTSAVGAAAATADDSDSGKQHRRGSHAGH